MTDRLLEERLETKYWRVNKDHPDPDVIAEAGKALREGALVAFPTETVYGLGANALMPRAVRRIFVAKGRPADNPLIVHVCSMEQVLDVVGVLPEAALVLAGAFWPGPLTLVLPRMPDISDDVTGGLPTVAVRMPAHPVALSLIRAAGVPVAAPSANVSGRPSPTSGDHVYADLAGRVEVILDAGPAPQGLESTILDLTVAPPVILRPGGITRQDLEQVLQRPVDVGRGAVTRPLAPGMKYRHYAPQAALYLIEGATDEMPVLLSQTARELTAAGHRVVVVCTTETAPDVRFRPVLSSGSRNSPAEVGANLYSLLRRCDDEGFSAIVFEAVPTTGVGEAVMNRLQKAAGQTGDR